MSLQKLKEKLERRWEDGKEGGGKGDQNGKYPCVLRAGLMKYMTFAPFT